MDNASGQSLKRLKVAVVVLIVGLVILTAYHLFLLSKFRVVSTDPNVGQVSSAIPFFKINFNKPVAGKGLIITSNPNIIGSYKVDDKTVNISLTPLATNEAYAITINSITATDGEVITNKAFHFTAQYINPSSLPQDQQKAIIHSQENYSSPANDPIVAHLPYSTLNFTLSAQVTPGSNGKSALVLQAVLLLNEAEMSNQTAAAVQDEQMVSNYISSLGLNPSNYTIKYAISTP
ncbi:MAG TPA: hypothetical protein VNG32_05020 [Candidatus Dormibacteraeota bacterium]|nr:hypothetical protein [Candidatus Dormibacteraeota bacterium]